MHEAYPHLACCFMLLDHEDYPHLAAFADCMHSTRPCLMLALKMKYYFETYTASSHAYFHPFNVAIFIIYYIRTAFQSPSHQFHAIDSKTDDMICLLFVPAVRPRKRECAPTSPA